MKEEKIKRLTYLDAARCLAILLVALNHAANRVWVNYGRVQAEFETIGRVSTMLKALLTVSSRLGVPLFLMITGVLILNKRFDTKESLSRFYKHNWLELLISTEIWLFIGFWFLVMFDPDNFMLVGKGIEGTLKYCVKTLLFIDQVRFGSMWYMAMILCVYPVLPIVAIALQRGPSCRILLLPLALLIYTTMLLPAVNAYREVLGKAEYVNYLYYWNLFSMYLIYICAGWWIAEGGMSRLPDAAVAAGTVLGLLLCAAVQYFYYSRTAHLLSYESPGVLVVSVFVFELFRRLDGWFSRWRRPLAAVSRGAFGLYLLHVFFIESLYWYFDFGGWSHMAKLAVLEFVPLLASAAIILPLSKIPFCRRWLFLIK